MMRFRFQSLGAVLLAIMVSGCASSRGYPERPEAVKDKLKSLQDKFFLPKTDVLKVYSETKKTEKQEYRDSVVYGRLLALDMQYAVFKETVYEEAIVSNLSLDILGIAVGVAGAVTTGADASRILSALSGGISGTRTTINKNLFYERTMPALLALMDAERDSVRAEILEGLTQDVDVYPLGRALTDLERYLQVGSIPGALGSVTKVAGKTKAEADVKLKIVREANFVDPQAQQRVSDLLDSVEELPDGEAWNILNAPPAEIDDFVKSAIKGRLGGKTIAESANVLRGEANDAKAKAVLKMALVLMGDRSPENIMKWKAAIQALLQ